MKKHKEHQTRMGEDQNRIEMLCWDIVLIKRLICGLLGEKAANLLLKNRLLLRGGQAAFFSINYSTIITK